MSGSDDTREMFWHVLFHCFDNTSLQAPPTSLSTPPSSATRPCGVPCRRGRILHSELPVSSSRVTCLLTWWLDRPSQSSCCRSSCCRHHPLSASRLLLPLALTPAFHPPPLQTSPQYWSAPPARRFLSCSPSQQPVPQPFTPADLCGLRRPPPPPSRLLLKCHGHATRPPLSRPPYPAIPPSLACATSCPLWPHPPSLSPKLAPPSAQRCSQ